MSTTTTTAHLESPNVVQTIVRYYRDLDPGEKVYSVAGTAGAYLRPTNEHDVQIHDFRDKESDFNLDNAGFQLFQHSSQEKAFTDEEKIKEVVYPETEELLKDATGATKVHVFSHIIRRDSLDGIIEHAASLPPDAILKRLTPARFVHVDQSPAGALGILTDNLDPEAAAVLRKSRWSIINVWRPIKPIAKSPLTVCDARSVRDGDLVPYLNILPAKGSGTFENVTKGASFESFAVRADPRHKWYYASGMGTEEVMLIKCFDSRKDVAWRTPHCSFEDPRTKDESTRESIEIRCLVFHEDQPVD